MYCWMREKFGTQDNNSNKYIFLHTFLLLNKSFILKNGLVFNFAKTLYLFNILNTYTLVFLSTILMLTKHEAKLFQLQEKKCSKYIFYTNLTYMRDKLMNIYIFTCFFTSIYSEIHFWHLHEQSSWMIKLQLFFHSLNNSQLVNFFNVSVEMANWLS